jgi:hypothetical protein
MTPPPPPPPFALDLDHPAGQQAVLRYLSVMAETLRRAADAVEDGNEGRPQAIDELACLQVLCHYLCRRLTEPAEPHGRAGEAGEREGPA